VIHDPYGFGSALRSAADRRRKPRVAKMGDQPLFLRTLSRFAVVLPAHYDLEAALSELTESVRDDDSSGRFGSVSGVAC